MKKRVMAFTLAALAGQPTLVVAQELKTGDRVAGTAAFFLCSVRDDIQAMRALARQGDRESAIKLGTARCQQGRPGEPYFVVETAEDAVCIRRPIDAVCLWAQRASLHPAGPQG